MQLTSFTMSHFSLIDVGGCGQAVTSGGHHDDQWSAGVSLGSLGGGAGGGPGGGGGVW